MEFETSSATIISAPLVVRSARRAPVRGRAKPITKKKNARQKSTMRTQPLEREREGMSASTSSGSPKAFTRRFRSRRRRPYPSRKSGMSSSR